MASFLRDPTSVVFQAAVKENGSDAYDLLLFGVSSGGGVSGSLSYAVPVLLLAGDCPGLGTYLVDVSEVCGNGCGISAVVGDTSVLQGLDAPGGYTLLDAWKNSGEDKAKVLLIKAEGHYYLALRPKNIEENKAVTVVLRHPAAGGIASTPVRITLTPNAVTPGLLRTALTEALKEGSPQSAQNKFQESLLTKLTQNYNAKVHPVIVPPTADDREAKDLVESALLSCGGDNTIPVEILDKYNTLENVLRSLLLGFDMGKVGAGGRFAVCLVDRETLGLLELSNVCYGQFIDRKIAEEVLSPATVGGYTAACTAGVVMCEVAYKGLAAGPVGLVGTAVWGLGEGALVCGLPAAMGYSVRNKVVEQIKETGEAGFLALASATIPQVGTLGVGASLGTVKYLLRSPDYRRALERAVAIVEKYRPLLEGGGQEGASGVAGRLARVKGVGPFARYQYKTAVEFLERTVEQMRGSLPSVVFEGRDAVRVADLVSKLTPGELRVLAVARRLEVENPGIFEDVRRNVAAFVGALERGDKEQARLALKEMLSNGEFREAFLREIGGEEMVEEIKRAAERAVLN
ncbi:MAG: hypothetical protein GSR77_07595, partial [Desulfurococcales archaeon]|nr:hypothetical protein [Desulfurococcales archaeon]